MKNDSKGIGADISIELEYTNCEYFKVTEYVQDSQLRAGDSTTVTVTVELIKTPVDGEVSTVVKGKLYANSIDDELAVGSKSLSDSSPYIINSFETDSWETIQYAVRSGNIEKYKLGDIKIVNINGIDYRVRISNLPNSDDNLSSNKCNNTNYSETSCGFVVEFLDMFNTRGMYNYPENVRHGYPESAICNYLNGELYNQLPQDLKNVIADTRVVTGNIDGGNFIQNNQKLFLLSSTEILGTGNYGHDSTNTTSQLDFYRENGTTSITYQVCACRTGCSNVVKTMFIGSQKMLNGSYYSYYLRNYHDSNTTYGVLDLHGQYSYAGYSTYYAVAPAFRIK